MKPPISSRVRPIFRAKNPFIVKCSPSHHSGHKNHMTCAGQWEAALSGCCRDIKACAMPGEHHGTGQHRKNGMRSNDQRKSKSVKLFRERL